MNAYRRRLRRAALALRRSIGVAPTPETFGAVEDREVVLDALARLPLQQIVVTALLLQQAPRDRSEAARGRESHAPRPNGISIVGEADRSPHGVMHGRRTSLRRATTVGRGSATLRMCGSGPHDRRSGHHGSPGRGAVHRAITGRIASNRAAPSACVGTMLNPPSAVSFHE